MKPRDHLLYTFIYAYIVLTLFIIFGDLSLVRALNIFVLSFISGVLIDADHFIWMRAHYGDWGFVKVVINNPIRAIENPGNMIRDEYPKYSNPTNIASNLKIKSHIIMVLIICVFTISIFIAGLSSLALPVSVGGAAILHVLCDTPIQKYYKRLMNG